MSRPLLRRTAASVCVSAAALTLLALAAAPLQSQEAPRVRGPGYSVPIPAGFHVDSTSGDAEISLWLRGGVTLAQDTSVAAPGYVWIAPIGTDAGGLNKPKECRRAGTDLAADLDGDLAGAGISETPVGRGCQVLVVERAAARARLATIMVDKATAFVATCIYEMTDAGPPAWCRAVIDGWRSEDPREGPSRIPPRKPGEHAGGDEQYDEAIIDEWPQVVSAPPLQYPPFMRQANIEGSVTLEAVVGTDGRIEPWSIRVVESTDPGFEPAAAAMLLATVFRPGRINGQPVRVLIQLPIVFQFKGKPER